MAEDLRDLVSRFTVVDERLASIRIKAKYFYISLICVHAPTEDKDDTSKDAFYDKLEVLYNRTRKWGEKVFLAQQSENTVCTRKQATMVLDWYPSLPHKTWLSQNQIPAPDSSTLISTKRIGDHLISVLKTRLIML